MLTLLTSLGIITKFNIDKNENCLLNINGIIDILVQLALAPTYSLFMTKDA